jgi:hypothetical protein
MANVEISIAWKESEKGRVCTAAAYSKEGRLLAKSHINLSLIRSLCEFYRTIDDRQIEKVAEREVRFILAHPELYQ